MKLAPVVDEAAPENKNNETNQSDSDKKETDS